MKLPPLNALRAFEAAARLGGYVAAGTELGISSAAISQQVRKLEDFLGKQVFIRRNNGVVLTDAGDALFDGAREAFRLISLATERHASPRSNRPLVVSSIGSIAEKWLVPRLVAYRRTHSDFRFNLRIEPDPINFNGHDIDLRLGYDASQYSGMAVTTLGRDTVMPMCSPTYLQAHPELLDAGMAAAVAQDLLHTTWGPLFGSLPGWSDWYAAAGLVPDVVATGSQVGNSGATLDLARCGLGIALGQRMMAEADLAEGRLIALSAISVPLGHPYCLVHEVSRQNKHHMAGLVEWLTGGFDATGAV
ncbi:MAG: LysR family transcriptional regulator [Sphingomonadales bacterium]|nr:LysR family transcriptional regulator [Sphingomonadales bacterium]